MGMIQDVPEKATSEVRASTSSGSVLPQEKLKLAFNLMKVSSRTLRVLEYRSSSVLMLLFFVGSTRVGGWPSPGRYRAECSERASEGALVREGCPSGEVQKSLQSQERLVFSIHDAVN